jgi:hypothetical protein
MYYVGVTFPRVWPYLGPNKNTGDEVLSKYCAGVTFLNVCAVWAVSHTVVFVLVICTNLALIMNRTTHEGVYTLMIVNAQ